MRPDPWMTQLPGGEFVKGPGRKEAESYKQGLPEASATISPWFQGGAVATGIA